MLMENFINYKTGALYENIVLLIKKNRSAL
jgi:hypothetical protein